MLIRFRRLREAVTIFLRETGRNWLALSEEEWKQLEYLIDLGKPFTYCTKLIGQTKGPSIHLVYPIYTLLFSMIESSKKKLMGKRKAWQRQMRRALDCAKEKLSKYYSLTTGSIGDLYGHAVLLCPSIKEEFWNCEEWEAPAARWAWEEHYWKSLKEVYSSKYAPKSTGIATEAQPTKRAIIDRLGLGKSRPEPQAGTGDELERYRNTSKSCLSSHCWQG